MSDNRRSSIKMNLKLKTMLVVSSVALLSAPVVRAQGHSFGGGSRASFAARPSLASRPSFASRPLANNARGYRTNGFGNGSYYRGGHGYGRYYYLGGVPYFYPFFGFGGFYGDGFYGNGFYGDGFYGGYAGGAYGNGYGYNGADGVNGPDGANGANGGNGAYEGRITNNGRNGQNGDQTQGSGPSLPSAVQRQLAKRGYYKGTVDGQFGPSSREALKRFQKSQGLKATGNIDEDSLDALGFTDKRQ